MCGGCATGCAAASFASMSAAAFSLLSSLVLSLMPSSFSLCESTFTSVMGSVRVPSRACIDLISLLSVRFLPDITSSCWGAHVVGTILNRVVSVNDSLAVDEEGNPVEWVQAE